MPTYLARGRTVVGTTGTVWANTANVVDGVAGTNPATYATWTNSTSGAVGSFTLGNFQLAAPIPAGETLTEFACVIRNGFNNAARISTVDAQALDNGVAIGSPIAMKVTSGVSDDRVILPVTEAQIKSSTFQIKVTITRKTVTQQVIWSIDHMDVEIDTNLAGGKLKVWNGSAWVDKPIKVWNGSAWVEKPLKVWNGSAWVLS